MVGGTVFARLIGRPGAPPPIPPPRHAEWLSESDIEDFHGYTSVLHDSMPLALFRAHLEIEPLPPCRENGVTEERDEERPTTRYPLLVPLPLVRVIELHGRGVPISGTALSAAFNCVSISSRELDGSRPDFSISTYLGGRIFGFWMEELILDSTYLLIR